MITEKDLVPGNIIQSKDEYCKWMILEKDILSSRKMAVSYLKASETVDIFSGWVIKVYSLDNNKNFTTFFWVIDCERWNLLVRAE